MGFIMACALDYCTNFDKRRSVLSYNFIWHMRVRHSEIG